MNRKELIDALADKTGTTKIDTDRALSALLEVITDTLKKGDSISLVGFVSISVQYFPLVSVQLFPFYRFAERDFCDA